MKILIAGCGDLGSRLAQQLLQQGHEVIALRRNPIQGTMSFLPADLTDKKSLQNLPMDFDVVFYTAAAPEYSDKSYKQTYVDGLRNLLEALQANKNPLHIFFISSTSVYGQNDGEWVDEQSDTEPDTFSGQRILQAEAILNDFDYPSTVVRFSGIYGPGRTRLIQQISSGKAVLSDQPLYTNRIHIEDCVGVLLHLFQIEPKEKLVLASDMEPVEFNTVLQWLAEQLNIELSAEKTSEHTRRRGNKRCSNKHLLASGYQFKYPSYREGYQELLNS